MTELATQGRDALSRLLYQLHVHGGEATRAELTTELEIGRSAAGYLIGELRARGLVTVDEHPEPPAAASGRPSHLVRVAPGAPYVVAVHLLADSLMVAPTAIGGQALASDSEPVPPRATPEQVADRITMLVRAAIAAQRRRGRHHCLALGVAVPSPVRTKDGLALRPLHLGWDCTPLAGMLRERLPDLDVVVGNDANLAALAEYRHGAGVGCRQLVYLTTEHVGIGGGFVADGRLFVGSHGYALEAGHVTVDPRGVRCACGSTGCLEVEADQRGLLRAAGEPDEPLDTLNERADAVIDASRAGDEQATRAVRHVARRLGSGLAALVNLFDPDRVVLGGLLGSVYAAQPDEVLDRLRQRSYIDSASGVLVATGTLPAPALLGAAEVALQALLDNPRAVLTADDERR